MWFQNIIRRALNCKDKAKHIAPIVVSPKPEIKVAKPKEDIDIAEHFRKLEENRRNLSKRLDSLKTKSPPYK